MCIAVWVTQTRPALLWHSIAGAESCLKHAVMSDPLQICHYYAQPTFFLRLVRCSIRSGRTWPSGNSGVATPAKPRWAATKQVLVSCEAMASTSSATARSHLPLGIPTNPPLRSARTRAYTLFDQLWKDGGMTRQEAYGWLASVTGVNRLNAHIGGFNIDQCWAVADAADATSRELWPSSQPAAEPAQAIIPDPVDERERRIAPAPTWLAPVRIEFEAFECVEHLVVHVSNKTVDFWPGTQLWTVRGEDAQQKGIHTLVKFCKRS